MTPQEFLAIRRALGMSQFVLGQQLGLHRNTVQAYESGKWPIPSPVARLLPFLLGATITQEER